MTERIRKLMEQRNAALAKARAILDAAEGRALTAEEQQQYDGYDQEIDQLTARIETEQRQEQREREMAGSANGDRNPAQGRQPGGETREAADAREYRGQLLQYLGGGSIGDRLIMDAPERRAILGVNITTPATGGVLAPTELERIGDYAKGIARINLMIGDKPLVKSLVDIPLMAQKASNMLHQALTAFTELDTDLAARIVERTKQPDAVLTCNNLLEIIGPGAHVLAIFVFSLLNLLPAPPGYNFFMALIIAIGVRLIARRGIDRALPATLIVWAFAQMAYANLRISAVPIAFALAALRIGDPPESDEPSPGPTASVDRARN